MYVYISSATNISLTIFNKCKLHEYYMPTWSVKSTDIQTNYTSVIKSIKLLFMGRNTCLRKQSEPNDAIISKNERFENKYIYFHDYIFLIKDIIKKPNSRG